MYKIPELLAPAGDMEKLRVAVAYGADAVYLGGRRFGLRAFSDNFTDEQMQEAAALVHAKGRRLYVTLNMFAHNDDLAGLPEYVDFLAQIGCDKVQGFLHARPMPAPEFESFVIRYSESHDPL